jgi:hypothetical protein
VGERKHLRQKDFGGEERKNCTKCPSRHAASLNLILSSHLALIAGLYTQLKPKVIMAMYPITDPLGTFFCEDEVDSSHDIHAAAIRCFLDPKGPVVSNSQGTDRDKLYRWVVSEGNYGNLLRFGQYSDSETESWRISKQIPAYGLPPTPS